MYQDLNGALSTYSSKDSIKESDAKPQNVLIRRSAYNFK